jgi:hypothetical protein
MTFRPNTPPARNDRHIGACAGDSISDMRRARDYRGRVYGMGRQACIGADVVRIAADAGGEGAGTRGTRGPKD